jgi:exosortase
LGAQDVKTPRGSGPLWAAAAGVLAVAAYGPIVWGVWGTAPDLSRRVVEGWFFEPLQPPAGMVIAVAGWLAWRRRAALAELAPAGHPSAPFLLLVGLACAAWSKRAGAPDWLIFSLAANALAFAVASRGVGALRLLVVPLVALLFAVPIPDPFGNELVWALQRIAARGALWLHGLAGLGTTGEAVMLQRGESGFLVIEECSGLRGLLTLLLASIVIRDLFAHAGARAWWVVALAPPLALAINVVRVAWIARGDATGAAAGHIGQGVSTLLAGTVLLFFVGHLLARRVPEPAPSRSSGGSWPWRGACVGLAAVVALTAAIPTRPSPERPKPVLRGRFADRGGWLGEHVGADYLFLGRLPVGEIVQRRFEQRGARGALHVVELFVGLEGAGRPRESLYASKLALPGRDWSLRESSSRQDWRLFREVEVGVAGRGEQRALVQTWRLGDAGPWRETLRSFLAARPGRAPRVVVRLVTPILRDTPLGRAQARQVLDRFLIDFGGELEALEQGGDG